MTTRNHKMGELSFDRFLSFPCNALKTLVHRKIVSETEQN
jgi:hypothetical protein